MITVPLFPQLRVLLTIGAPLLVYLFWYFVWPQLKMTDPDQRARILWLLAIIPLFPVFVIGIDINAVLTHLFPRVYVHIGPFRDVAIYQRFYPGRPVPSLSMPIWLFVILAARLIGLVYALLIGIGEYILACWRLRQLPQRREKEVIVLEVEGWFGFTFGLLRPRIYLSEAVWNSPHRLAVETHEMLHVRRYDPLRRVILQSIRRLLWFLPFWGRLVDQIEFETERSCDRQACRIVHRSAYARALVAFAENAHSHVAPDRLAPCFVMSTRHPDALSLLIARLRAIACPIEVRPPAWFWPAFYLVYLVMSLVA